MDMVLNIIKGTCYVDTNVKQRKCKCQTGWKLPFCKEIICDNMKHCGSHGMILIKLRWMYNL